MVNKLALFLVFFLSHLSITGAQDPVFSQFYAHPLELNPALAGNSGGTRAGLNYRNQWNGLSSNYITYSISADQFLHGLNSGVGISLLSDEAGQGIYRTFSGELSYAYQIELRNNFKIKMGIQPGFISVRLDYDKLIFRDQIDPIEGPISPGGLPYPTSEIAPDQTSLTKFDLGMGAMVHNEYFYAGLALKHLLRPDLNFYPEVTNTKHGLPLRVVAHTGVRIPLGAVRYGREPELSILPNLLFVKQGVMGQINGGSVLQVRNLYFGLYYRHAFRNPDAVILSLGFDASNIRIGYSYDATVSGLGFNSGGTHEISLSAVFYQDNGGKYSDCTKLFR